MLNSATESSQKSNIQEFHGMIDSRNRHAFQEYLAKLDPEKHYLLYEYDISGNIYHSGPKEMTGSLLANFSHFSHFSHSFRITDLEGNTICNMSHTYTSRSIPDKVNKILH